MSKKIVKAAFPQSYIEKVVVNYKKGKPVYHYFIDVHTNLGYGKSAAAAWADAKNKIVVQS